MPTIQLRTALVACSLSVACGARTADAPASAARCTDCDIELRRVGVLTDAFEPGALPDVMVYATRDRAGRVFTVTRHGDGILIFNADGSLLRRLGRPGDGPGEFRRIRRVFNGPGDSLYVADWGVGRMTVYAPDFSVARTHPILTQPALVLRDSRFVVAEQIAATGRAGFPLHVADTAGTIVRSFGTDTPEHRRDTRLFTTRLTATSSSGDVWTVAPGRYVIERWDPATGERRQRIEIQSSWFRELAAWPDDDRTRPPAVIECLWEDADGLIWLTFRDADLDWRAPALANVERPLENEEYARTYDWIVEAVDPRAERVIASKRFREILWARPPSNVLVTARHSTADRATFDVWQPVLVPR